MLATSELSAAERILIYRRRLGLNQTEAALHWAVTPWEYRLWENGERNTQPTVRLGILQDNEACLIMRRRAGLSRTACAKAVGISNWWLTQMEHGKIPTERLVKFWSE